MIQLSKISNKNRKGDLTILKPKLKVVMIKTISEVTSMIKSMTLTNNYSLQNILQAIYHTHVILPIVYVVYMQLFT